MIEQNIDATLPWTVENQGLLFRIVENGAFFGERPLILLMQEIDRHVRSVVVKDAPQGQKETKIKEAQLAFINALRELALNALNNPNRAEAEYLVSLGRCIGRYDEQIDDLHSPEYIKLHPNENDPTDIVLGPNINDLTPEQQSVFVDLYRAKTVVNNVFERRIRRSAQADTGLLNAKARANGVISQNVKSLYLKELRDIGMVAVESPMASDHARKRLEAFRESFVTREAEVVKTQHIRRLAVYCAGFAAFPLVGMAVSLWHNGAISKDGWHTLLIISLMAAASCVGTWLSFSLRKVSLTYGDLAGLEEDRLDPGGRVVFVMLLTTILALVLYSGVLSISIGETHFTFSGETTNTAEEQILYALLVGVFAGIAERSLSGLVSKQAEDVIGASSKAKS